VSRAAGQDVGPPHLPGYRFVSHIGAGGNARVYLYEQNLPRRKVAVKVLNESALSEAARRRFTDEANVTAGLAHRHIVGVFEANVTADGRPYLVMPYYPQPNLLARARRSHFSVAEVLRIGVQIGSAVETSHRSEVLHRDIKPQNILTDSYGEPVLTDFGIATTNGGDGPEGLSVPWSPPEILYGTSPGDQRADVYSLGATLWHLLVGRSPFEVPGGDNGTGALMVRINAEPPPRTRRADVPDSLERLLRRAMAKDPAARPQSAMELIRGLQAVEQELRMPLTQPILPVGEPSGDTAAGDTVVRPQVRVAADVPARERAAGPTDDPAAGAAVGGSWEADAGSAEPRPQHDRVPADSHLDPRAHGVLPDRDRSTPQGFGPRSQPTVTDEDPTRLRKPLRIDTQGAPAGARSRGLPPEAPGAAAAAPRPGAAETEGVRRRGRVLAAVGGGMLIVAVAVAVAAVLAFSHGSGGPSSVPTAGQTVPQPAGQNALGPAAAAPGQPTVTARRVTAEQVEFSWTYANAASGDTFRWQEVSGGSGKPVGVATKPDLLLTVPPGQSACITVTVRSADGDASQPSSPVCWSN
jgi:hypothetical protein